MASPTTMATRLLRRRPRPRPQTLVQPLSTTTSSSPSLPVVDIGPLRDPSASHASRLQVAEALHKVRCVCVCARVIGEGARSMLPHPIWQPTDPINQLTSDSFPLIN